MEAPTLADRVEARLRAAGTRHRAEGEKRYLKSELDFLGPVSGWRHARIGRAG